MTDWILNSQSSLESRFATYLKSVNKKRLGSCARAVVDYVFVTTIQDPGNVSVTISRRELADKLGYSDASVRNAVAKLRKEKIISVDTSGYSNSYRLRISPHTWKLTPHKPRRRIRGYHE